MKGSTLFAIPKDLGGSLVLTRVRSLIELLIAEKARPRGVDLVAAGKCPRGAISPVACMFCQEGHLLDCHAGQTCEEARCSHHIPNTYEGIDLNQDPEVLDLMKMEREARK
jgi:hypothetical protein